MLVSELMQPILTVKEINVSPLFMLDLALINAQFYMQVSEYLPFRHRTPHMKLPSTLFAVHVCPCTAEKGNCASIAVFNYHVSCIFISLIVTLSSLSLLGTSHNVHSVHNPCH
jgi:hypothetical protein